MKKLLPKKRLRNNKREYLYSLLLFLNNFENTFKNYYPKVIYKVANNFHIKYNIIGCFNNIMYKIEAYNHKEVLKCIIVL